jgi:hypothetical protein
MIYLDSYEWICQNNDLYGINKCKHRNAIDEEKLIQFAKEKIEGYREHIEILEERLKTYICLYFSLDTENQLLELNSKIKELKIEFDNRVRLNGKGIITDDELQEFIREYRKKLNECQKQERKIKNLDKEIEEVNLQYKDFINYLNKVDVANLTNADLKRIFNHIEVGTYPLWPDEKGLVKDFSKVIEKSPYTRVNKNNNTFKHITAEHTFMDISEGNIYDKRVII